MPYTTHCPVRFAHVDAAGIVFYPRYFEMLNGAVEDWFAEQLGADFASLHLDRRIGVPTVSLQSEFMAPSRLGTMLEITLSVTKLGRSSLALEIVFAAEGVQRLVARPVLVCIDLDSGQSIAWPEDLRAALEQSVAA